MAKRFVVRRSTFAALGSLFAVLAYGATLLAQASGNANWPLHNLDLAGGRFSSLDRSTTSNVATLGAPLAVPDRRDRRVSNQTTPIVVDGSMYVTDPRGSVYALDAADGRLLWTFDVTELIGGGAKPATIFRKPRRLLRRRVVYTGAGSFFRTRREERQADQDVRKDGQASVILDVIKERYPDVTAAITLGYWFTTARRRCTMASSTSAARAARATFPAARARVDAKTGRVLWHFNTIPQDGRDQGWELAVRPGSAASARWGIWETPSIDPELGLIYVAVGNRSRARSGSAPTYSPIRFWRCRSAAAR